jgi:hypothetical protein
MPKRQKESSQFASYVQSIASSILQESRRPVSEKEDDNSTETTDEGSVINNHHLWSLPDTILFHILSFTAAPTHRAGVLCHQLTVLCRASYSRLFQNSTTLWEAILQQDYGAHDPYHSSSTTVGNKKRRICPRLERSAVDRVKEAHGLVKNNTEIAFYYLSEHVNASNRKASLTKSKLCRLLEEYGPHLRINQRVSSGGLFLVEVCRARHVKEAVLLKCVQELVEIQHAIVDQRSYESPSTYQTAICVAAVRGMFSIVQYLLEKKASIDIRCSGRVRLNSNSKKTIRCVDQTPLEFAKQVRAAEMEHGAANGDLKDLNKCITLMERADTETGNRKASST